MIFLLLIQYNVLIILTKHRYFANVCMLVCRFGPMVRTWCMRYEAKHQYFKRLAGYMGNFTNVAYTLAKRHQEQMCYVSNCWSKPENMDVGKQFLLYFIARLSRHCSTNTMLLYVIGCGKSDSGQH